MRININKTLNQKIKILLHKMEKKYKIISLEEEDEKNKNDLNMESFYPTPNTKENSTKPDFSPILLEETQFGFKTNGSYKKRKIFEPQSPIKLVEKNYSTSAKIEGKDLFNIKNDKSFCRKLNFDENEEEKEQKKIQNKKENDKTKINTLGLNIFNKSLTNNKRLNLRQNKMEKDFTIIKTIKSNKLDYVYKVKEKITENIFCIKKIYKKSNKNNVNNMLNLFSDMNNQKNYENILLGYNFCNHYKDYWLEEENLDMLYKDICIKEEFFYILYDYCPNGDLLDFLGKLEINNYRFTPDFYWDIIFEMIMGLKYFHELGYLHLDIKPTNFLVDKNGYIKLSDFGLCQKISEVSFLTDIVEGDKIYISKECFNFNSHRKLNEKADIFSLGLSIFEILAKINLPSSGDSWKELRSDNFQIKQKLLDNWNIDENKDLFIELISKMIAPLDKRSNLQELISDFEQLDIRYKLLKNNNYKKSVYIPQLKDY